MSACVRVFVDTGSSIEAVRVRCNARGVAVAAHALGAGDAASDHGGSEKRAGRSRHILGVVALNCRDPTQALCDLVLWKWRQLRST